jgi:hypothetical protein
MIAVVSPPSAGNGLSVVIAPRPQPARAGFSYRFTVKPDSVSLAASPEKTRTDAILHSS